VTQLEPGEGSGLIGGGAAWERRIDAVLGVAASAILFGMMTLTFADVMGRYLFRSPVRGGFEITELSLLVLIFAGLPLVTRAGEHVTMDLIDRLLGPRACDLLNRAIEVFCALLMFLLTWLMWLKAGKVAGYTDSTDVLRIPLGPFVYFMAAMIGLSGAVHLFRAFARGSR
jgi:TRAP-type C4-dicarboxylate transport system permease small subunit